MAFDTQRDLARLLRIRHENNAGRMVAGLGARNVPWAQAHAGPLGADVSGYKGVVSAGDQAAFADKQFATYDRRLAEIEARQERFRNLARKSGMAGPNGMDAPMRPGGSSANTLRQRLAKRGFGIESEGFKLGPVQWTRAGLQLNTAFLRSANRFGGKLFAGAVVGQVVAGGLNAVSNTIEIVRRTDSAGEALKAGGLGLVGGARESVSGIFALDDIAASVATILGVTQSKDEARRKQSAFYDNLFATSEELGRRAKARNDALSAMYQEVNKNVGEMWAVVNNTLPQSFSLRKDDLGKFRTELNRVNAVAIAALKDVAKTQGERAIEGGDASGN